MKVLYLKPDADRKEASEIVIVFTSEKYYSPAVSKYIIICSVLNSSYLKTVVEEYYLYSCPLIVHLRASDPQMF